MAITKWYYQGLVNALKGNILWKTSGGGDFRVALLTASYTPAQSTHDAWDDVSTYEVSSTNYTAGGTSMTELDPVVNTTYVDIIPTSTSSTTWAGPCTFDARYAVIYQYNATPASALLLAYVDFETTQSCVAGSFTIDWNDTTATLRINVS